MKIIRILCFTSLVITSACTSLIVHLQSARFDSPEVAGPWGKRLSVGAGLTHDVTIASDTSSRPPTLGTPTDDTDLDIPLRVGLGLGQIFEIGLRYGFPVSAAMLTGKVQLLGHTARESVPGDISLALAAGYGTQSSAIGGNQNGVFGPGGFNWNANETTNVADYSVLFGYRPTEKLMIYGGPFYTKYTMSGNVHDDLSDNGTSPATDYALAGQGQETGLNADFEFTFSEKKLFSLSAEVQYLNFQWTNLTPVNDLRAAAMCEWVF